MNATSATSPAQYTVFISHRTKDKHVAHSIKKLLAEHTVNIDYFVSEEIEKSDRWRQTIIEQLHNSHFLILVFTDPDENWHWCLYETGFFDALTQLADQSRRIYCLHHPDIEPPAPIADLRRVIGKRERVRCRRDRADRARGQGGQRA
jgi:TIR domain